MDRMTHNEGSSPISDTSRGIMDEFNREFLRAQATQGKGNPAAHYEKKLDPKSYVDLLKEVMNLADIAPANLAEAILPQRMLKERLETIDQSSRLKMHFPEGYRIQITPIPFSYYGTPMSEEELLDGGHLVQLLRENKENGRTISGFSQFPTLVHKLFPQEFQECSFVVPEYDSESPFDVTQEDRNRLKRLYTDTFNKLRDIITETATRVYH